MQKFSHLSKSERDEIAILKKKRYALRDIAQVLQRSVSTIADELKRNRVKGHYTPAKADHKAYTRRKYARYQGMKIVTHRRLRVFVEEKLFDDHSPEAIAGRLKKKREGALPSVSKNSVYRYITSVYGRQIEAYRKRQKARRRMRRAAKTTQLPDRTFIDKRPLYIEKRIRVGDAEADFIVSGKSGKGVLLVVVDRKSRSGFLERIVRVTIENVHRAFACIKKRFPELRTVTTDNDLLLQKHAELARLLNVRIYFCHPYHSWEKGTVENTNKHIRKRIPKGCSIAAYSATCIRALEHKLNRRILACLAYRTPAEVLQQTRGREKTKKRLRALKR